MQQHIGNRIGSEVRGMELSKRDKLYNAILETVIKHGAGMEIGLVRAVLGEVDGEIVMRIDRQSLDIVREQLKERKTRGCK